MRSSQVVFSGSIVGRDTLTNFELNPAFYFSGCRLCGAVYQEEPDRNPPVETSDVREEWLYEQKQRHNAWRERHNREHKEHEHRRLALSGNWATPEASLKLGPLGVFSLIDLSVDDSVSAALREAPRAPDEDAQDMAPKGL